MALPDCPDINNWFESEANRIAYAPSRKPWTTTPWDGNDIVPKIAWEDGMGETPNVLIYDRATPLNGPMEFQTVSFNDGGSGDAGGSCDPPTSTLYPSTRRLSFQLKNSALESPMICVFDARMDYNMVQQGDNLLRLMNNNIRNAWQNQRRDEFTFIASNKAVADAGMTTNSSTFATGTIGRLQREMLDYWWLKLTDDGADEDNGLTMNQYNQPVMPLVISYEGLQALIDNETTLNNARWSTTHNNQLLGPLGSFTSLNGYRIMIDRQAARWNLVNGAWVRVPFYSTVTVAGNPTNVNPDYYDAEYEDLYIPSRKVVQFAIPKEAFTAGPMNWATQDYMGSVRWINEYDYQCNKDKNKGYFRGLVAYGAKPGIPEYGVVLRYRRCPQAWTVNVNCS